MRLIVRWWCEEQRRYIYLRGGGQPATYTLTWTVRDGDPHVEHYASEHEARAAAQAMMDTHPGHWQRQPI